MRDAYNYDPVTGSVTWKKTSRCTILPGSPAGHRGKRDGRCTVTFYGKPNVPVHRLAFFFMTGAWPPEGTDVDHIDRNPSNNSWSNLRLANKMENGRNRGANKNNTSGFKGVTLNKRAHPSRRWTAQIMHRRQHYNLGGFPTPEEAAAAYDAVAAQLHGEFAKLNNPEPRTSVYKDPLRDGWLDRKLNNTKNNKSGFKGVSLDRRTGLIKRWRARIGSVTLGHYHTPEDAYEVFCSAALFLYGESVNLD